MVFTRPQLFFTTPPSPCPYKEGELEQKLVTEITGDQAVQQYDLMIRAGFRRSHNFLYRPHYERPDYCLSVRIRVPDFKMRKSQRRIWNRNSDIRSSRTQAFATEEQFKLFKGYVTHRHGDGDMKDMDWTDYRDMVECSLVDTEIIEYRTKDDELLAACLVDWVHNGVSAVYSFFKTTEPDLGLGSYIILSLVDLARQQKLPFVYLGYWIKESPKMAYKAKFQPLEAFQTGEWRDI
ncbi:arginyltransferase [Kiloniella laminariae]|uniref:Aspartate/glutamate leucyltransferase n=1 Tax=Kiloniella laminariae TaxID=454162 RepID=A0ABT4LGE0_9PROT|nr:arginyltransferase [Kiloniella laminariae]MCZ4280165.1 arginyltransferase [Kiloniella laminariae]